MFILKIGLLLFCLAEFSRHVTARTNNFDVLIFTQRWPQTVCLLWEQASASHTCSLPRDKKEWTIHGIWPSQYHKLGPQFCNPSLPFNKNALRPLEQQLKEKWIDVEYGRDSYSLWQHEWTKHGTCATVLEELNTEEKYFRQGLRLLDKYDMKYVLAEANIVPGRAYAVMDLFNTVQEVLGKRSLIICKKDKYSGESYILEIRICLNKMLELIDCDNVYEYPTNCDPSQNVIYPNAVSHDYRVVQM